MHKFVGVLDNPHKGENFFRVIKVAAHTYGWACLNDCWYVVYVDTE